MSELAFALRMILITVVVVILLQIKIGEKTLEHEAMDWIRTSTLVDYLNDASKGGLIAINDGIKSITSKVKSFGSKKSAREFPVKFKRSAKELGEKASQKAEQLKATAKSRAEEFKDAVNEKTEDFQNDVSEEIKEAESDIFSDIETFRKSE